MISKYTTVLCFSSLSIFSTVAIARPPISSAMNSIFFSDEGVVDPNITCENFGGKWQGSCKLKILGRDSNIDMTLDIFQLPGCRTLAINSKDIALNTVETSSVSAFGTSNVSIDTKTTEVDRYSWDKDRKVIQMEGTTIFHRAPKESDSLISTYKGSIYREGAKLIAKLTERADGKVRTSYDCSLDKVADQIPLTPEN